VAQGVPAGRSQAVMAAMIEGVNRGKTRKGKDFVRADFSDSTGQFSAACFEESLVEPMQRWAAESTCVLLTVELDAPSPEEPPRVTVRGARPLSEVTSAARMLLSIDVDRAEALPELALMLEASPQESGEVRARLRTVSGAEPVYTLGSNFRLHGDLAEQLSTIEGLANITLTAKRGGVSHLRLVA
jgi:DNA polymerase III subunit alpha